MHPDPCGSFFRPNLGTSRLLEVLNGRLQCLVRDALVKPSGTQKSAGFCIAAWDYWEMTQNGSKSHGLSGHVPKWGQYPGVFPGCNTKTLRT